MDKSELESNAISYLKANLEKLFSMYLNGHNQLDEKLAFFTAGPSGAGKTEFVQEILNIESDLVHLDIDEIRNFFTDIGYDGSNSDLFQKPASYGVQYLFEEIVKTRGLSFFLDSNLAKLQTAQENIKKLLDEDYSIEIFYIYNDLKTCFLYTKKRELVTKRMVPEDVFLNNAIESRLTTYKLKKIFGDKITLNVVDKMNDNYYENITYEQFDSVVPEFESEEDND